MFGCRRFGKALLDSEILYLEDRVILYLIFVQIWFNIKISYTLWEVLWLEKMYIYTLSPESS